MKRITVRESGSGHYNTHINSGGRYPGSWGTFDYRFWYDLDVESVQMTLGVEPSYDTREHFPSLQKGLERVVHHLWEHREFVTSLVIEVAQITRHPLDYEIRGSSHGVFLLTDIIRKHGHEEPALQRDWVSSNVFLLVQGMLATNDFSGMPILADALQDAGCDSEDVLNHCRGTAIHTAECWVLRMIIALATESQ